MTDRLLTRLLVVGLCLTQIRVAVAQGTPDPWYGRSPRPRDFEAPKTPLGNFAIELPKNWQIVPGYAQIILTAAEKTRSDQVGAAIVLEHVQLRSPLPVTPAVADVELTTIREREPGGQDFSQQIKQGDGRPFIFIQYTRRGHAGPDRVVQYSILAGSVMYRLICVVSAAQFAKYQSIFAHVAASFKAATPGST
jgi:hypothetical protein